ncbi:MAG: glycosyltransferase [Candidatus Altiarchaeales archaeon]|nr:glycosyltransferase [Candidatus Altiarchaeales archaeon]MBD3415526.1 glycosyltransferase [Candidatus Altiarchaeales archaeon]
MKVSVILPCRNEEAALGECIDEIREALEGSDYEIIVSDSSTDRSPEIAREKSAKVVKHDLPGYGRAYLEGFKEAAGDYFMLGDADGTYDFKEIPEFLKALDGGFDLVIGDRFRGRIHEGAMPWHHRHIGNPLLSWIFRLFFNADVHDTHCGLRAVRRDALEGMELKTTGMEFASEMLIKATEKGLRIGEIPIEYHVRKGESKLRSFSDGWRHLRFMLMYAPDRIFLAPGAALLALGLAAISYSILGYAGDGISPSVVAGMVSSLLGYQVLSLGLYSKTYMKSAGYIGGDRVLEEIAKRVRFETGVVLGFLMGAGGVSLGLSAMSGYFGGNTGNVILASATIALMGAQTVFNSFYLSSLLVEKRG